MPRSTLPVLIVFQILAVGAVSVVLASPPPVLDMWGIDTDAEIRGLGVDAQGYVFVTDGTTVRKFTNGGEPVFTRHFIDYPFGVATDSDGNVYVVNTYTHAVEKFSNELEPLISWSGPNDGSWLGQAFGIALGGQGEDVFVRSTGQIDRFTREGVRDVSWRAGGGRGVAVDSQGRVYTAGDSRIYKFNDRGNLLNQWGPSTDPRALFGHGQGIAVTADGVVLVANGLGGVWVFDDQGQFRDYWRTLRGTRDIAIDPMGNIYILAGTTVAKFSGIFDLPPAPPPPPAPAPSQVMLHIADFDSGSNPCLGGPASVNDIVTSAEASSEGLRYFVYLLMSPGDDQTGLAGLQLGIEHGGTHGNNRDDALLVSGWTMCADLEYTDAEWPASGTGNTITWIAPSNCQFGPIVVAGFFDVTAYAPAVMAVVGFPPTGKVKTANCTAVEVLPDQTTELDQVGWVSMGRGSIGLDTDGCNPAVEPCSYTTVPVKHTTWGRIKTMYRN